MGDQVTARCQLQGELGPCSCRPHPWPAQAACPRPGLPQAQQLCGLSDLALEGSRPWVSTSSQSPEQLGPPALLDFLSCPAQEQTAKEEAEGVLTAGVDVAVSATWLSRG